MKSEEPYLSLVPPWEHDSEEELAETRLFSLRRRRGISPRRPDDPGEFVYLDSDDWVNVVALTPDRDVVLIEQFRHGTAEVTLEIPGGIVDPGEDALGAGVRELEEETGYAGEAEIIGTVTPNPAIMNNRCHTLLVRDARPVSGTRFERHEEIATRLEPLERIDELIRVGLIHHALVVAAFHHLRLLESRP